MITIHEAVSPLLLILSVVVSILILLLVYWRGFIHSFFDPSVLTFFQVFFTGFILMGTGLVTFKFLICYIVLALSLLLCKKVTLFKGVLITEEQWFQCTKVMIVISLISNVILLYTKGFILLADNPEEAKQYFYQDAGIYKRINDVTGPLVGVMSIYLFYQGKKWLGSLLVLYTVFILLSSGSKSGLVGLVFYLGAYIHFYRMPINKKVLAAMIVVGGISILGMFYWTYQDNPFDRFYRRTVAFADGPFYFYKGHLQHKISYPVDYPFDQAFTNLRIHDKLQYTSLGPEIINQYFGLFSPLYGPNPQFSVEAVSVFKSVYFLYPALLAFLFMIVRNLASTPFAFILLSMFFTPLWLDVQYAFANLISLLLLVPVLLSIKLVSSFSKHWIKPALNV
jgi:hypothetical protein